MPRHDQAPETLRPYLAALAKLGIEAETLEAEPHAANGVGRADAWLRLKGPWGEATRPCVVKRRVERGTLGAVLQNLQVHGGHALLFTEYVTPPLAEDLRKEGVAFVDAAGNAHITERGLYVWVTNRPRKVAAGGEKRAFHAAGLKLLFVLLRQREHRRNLRELAAEAGIALGGVANLLTEFERRGWIRRDRNGVVLDDGTAMLQRWNEGYPETLRAKLFLKACRRKPGTALDDLPKQVREVGLAGLVFFGGELGAALLTQYLRPETTTLHLDGIDAVDAMKRLDLIPDRDGDVMLLTTFGTRNRGELELAEGLALVDPLLLHAELLLRTDDRLRETAERIRIEYITPRWA